MRVEDLRHGRVSTQHRRGASVVEGQTGQAEDDSGSSGLGGEDFRAIRDQP